jgi:hypothetical protein
MLSMRRTAHTLSMSFKTLKQIYRRLTPKQPLFTTLSSVE